MGESYNIKCLETVNFL